MAAESRPESFLMIFFSTKDSIQQKVGIGGPPGDPRGRGAPRGVGRAPTLVDGEWTSPFGTSCAQYFFYILKITSVKFQDFWSCAE